MRKVLNLAVSIFLVVVSANLLYLYYAGYWYDPNQVIVAIELVFLWIFITLGLLNIIILFTRR